MNEQLADKICDAFKIYVTPADEKKPYEHKYTAVERWTELLTEVEDKLETTGSADELDVCAILSYLIGKANNETDEPMHAVPRLTAAIAHLCCRVGHPLPEAVAMPRDDFNTVTPAKWTALSIPVTTADPATIAGLAPIAMDGLNQVGLIWGNRSEGQLSLEFLNSAEAIYNSAKSSTTVPDATLDRLTSAFNLNIETLYTLTLYYSGQALTAQDPESAIEKIGRTLTRQLEFREYDPYDWVENAIMLSGVHTERASFREAHQLMTSVDEMVPLVVPTEVHNEEDVATLKARVHVSWGRVYSGVLEGARDRERDVTQPTHPIGLGDLWAGDGVVEVTSFTQAEELFAAATSHYDSALDHFVLDGFVTDHCDIALERSRAHHIFAQVVGVMGDGDQTARMERQCVVEEERGRTLWNYPKQLNPAIYLTSTREILFDLADSTTERFDLRVKLKKKNATSIGQQSIHIYNQLVKTYKDQVAQYRQSQMDSGEAVDMSLSYITDIDEESELIVTALFTLARVHMQLPSASRRDFEKALECFQTIGAWKAAHPNHEGLEEQVSISAEMAELLPLKIQLGL